MNTQTKHIIGIFMPLAFNPPIKLTLTLLWKLLLVYFNKPLCTWGFARKFAAKVL